MKIGCGEWGFRALPMEEHFRICQRFGFRTMEIGIGGGQPGRLPDRMTDDDIAAFLRLHHHYGIATPFCVLENDFTLPDPAAHRAILERVLTQLPLAKKLGATHVRLFAGFTPLAQMTEGLWQQMVTAFHACDKLCRQLGLTIGIETHGRVTPVNGALAHEHTVTTHRTALSRLLRELPPTIGITYDPANIKVLEPTDRRLCLDILNDRIVYCHLKDWRRVGPGWLACAPGDDDLDYGGLLPQLRYNGVYLIEYEPTEDVEDGIRRGLAYLLRCTGSLQFA